MINKKLTKQQQQESDERLIKELLKLAGYPIKLKPRNPVNLKSRGYG